MENTIPVDLSEFAKYGLIKFVPYELDDLNLNTLCFQAIKGDQYMSNLTLLRTDFPEMGKFVNFTYCGNSITIPYSLLDKMYYINSEGFVKRNYFYHGERNPNTLVGVKLDKPWPSSSVPSVEVDKASMTFREVAPDTGEDEAEESPGLSIDETNKVAEAISSDSVNFTSDLDEQIVLTKALDKFFREQDNPQNGFDAQFLLSHFSVTLCRKRSLSPINRDYKGNMFGLVVALYRPNPDALRTKDVKKNLKRAVDWTLYPERVVSTSASYGIDAVHVLTTMLFKELHPFLNLTRAIVEFMWFYTSPQGFLNTFKQILDSMQKETNRSSLEIREAVASPVVWVRKFKVTKDVLIARFPAGWVDPAEINLSASRQVNT